ncbi:hypothetical protein ACQPYK_22955 [Streptosporangium sp. CA-135522]
MVAEFETNIGHQRTREGMALAKEERQARGDPPPPDLNDVVRLTVRAST